MTVIDNDMGFSLGLLVKAIGNGHGCGFRAHGTRGVAVAGKAFV